MRACTDALPPMDCDAAAAFLAEPSSRGATVLILGRCSVDLCGIVVATPILSHAADLILVPNAGTHESDLLAEEMRRVLAPGGVVRLVTLGATEPIEEALWYAGFRDVNVAARCPPALEGLRTGIDAVAHGLRTRILTGGFVPYRSIRSPMICGVRS